MDSENAQLKDLKVDLIDRNPENPRLLFRQDELEELLNSIRIYGVQVPIAVYRDGKRFVLIDGERRWRCSKKLGLRTIPALVQPAPDPLNNLLLMFNIHSLREQWDLLTIAMKLPKVLDLLEAELGYSPREADICEKTGLNRGILRRCKLLIELPDRYKAQILEELHKPKAQQRLTEDFFIEMERSLKTVDRALPGVIRDLNKARDTLIQKYTRGVINNVIHFRLLAKIARSERVGIDPQIARGAVDDILASNGTSIEGIFDARFSSAYNEKDLASRIETIMDGLRRLDPDEVDPDLKRQLEALASHVAKLLEETE